MVACHRIFYQSSPELATSQMRSSAVSPQETPNFEISKSGQKSFKTHFSIYSTQVTLTLRLRHQFAFHPKVSNVSTLAGRTIHPNLFYALSKSVTRLKSFGV